MTLLTDQATWHQLEAYYANLKDRSLKRMEKYVLSAAGLSVDYSRNHLNETSLHLFSDLAEACNLSSAVRRLMAGGIVNPSEQQAAWHTILRDPDHQPEEVAACYAKIRDAEQQIRQQNITDIIHIGIGGSYLGPRFLYDVFASMSAPHIHCHFIANQNITAIKKLLHSLNPKKTLVIVVSKSFTTTETLENAKPILDWLQSSLPKHWQNHLIAVTAESERAIQWGALPTHIYPLWNWVGGRFSLWSAVSLSIIFAFGREKFQALLYGAHAMDKHFVSESWTSNIPVILAFIGLLYRHFFDAQTQAIIPYHNALTRLPSHLQQLHMESLGKQVSLSGVALNYPTGAVIWGGTGPGSQHSFHQLLFQGRDVVPIDFIAVTNDLLAYQSCLAQATALLQGNAGSNLPRYEYLPGNRPSTIISMSQLTLENLGALLAMYEHKVFVQSVLWDIDAFDQWGVEMGKQLLQKEL